LFVHFVFSVALLYCTINASRTRFFFRRKFDVETQQAVAEYDPPTYIPA